MRVGPAGPALSELRGGRGRTSTARSGDSRFRLAVTLSAGVVLLVLSAMLVFLLAQSLGAMRHYGFFSFLHSARWAPSEAVASQSSPNPYGILQFIYGTVLTSFLAMVIAVPLSVAVALYIMDFAPVRLRRPLSALVDLLAAIPSVIFGFWGVFALIPALRPIATLINGTLGNLPVVGHILSGPYFGFSYFSAAIVLAIMVLPIITSVCRETFATTPAAWKEAAAALGATRWEMVKVAVLKPSRAAIVGASVLGLGRAMGETIAVTMVIGNSVLAITSSIFGQGATMSSVIANEFTEATEPFHIDALFVVGFWLLIVVFIVNVIAQRVVARALVR